MGDLGESPDAINVAMKKTFRSDMKRRNVEWENVTNAVAQLARGNSVNHILTYIDRINNAIHNTGEIVLSKLPYGRQLMDAFERVHHSKLPREYAQYVSPEIRHLYRQYV
jgi:hypothetical protein